MNRNTQKKQSHKRIVSKTRSNRKFNNRISITIDFQKKDKGYTDFLQPRLVSFLMRNIAQGNNLVQTQEGKPFVAYKKNKLFLQCVPVKKWKQTPQWDEIKCESIGTTMKATPCDIGRNTKLFYKTKSTTHVGGLGIYIMGLVLGFIKGNLKVPLSPSVPRNSKTRSQGVGGDEIPLEFVQALQKTFKKRPICVHNEDVDWFHLKAL